LSTAIFGNISHGYGRLDEARHNVIRTFERIGVELFAEPADGLYVWVSFPGIEDSLALADQAAREGLVLAPGQTFSACDSTGRPGCGSTSLSAIPPVCTVGSNGFRWRGNEPEQGNRVSGFDPAIAWSAFYAN
jgi:hypothetical protein